MSYTHLQWEETANVLYTFTVRENCKCFIHIYSERKLQMFYTHLQWEETVNVLYTFTVRGNCKCSIHIYSARKKSVYKISKLFRRIRTILYNMSYVFSFIRFLYFSSLYLFIQLWCIFMLWNERRVFYFPLWNSDCVDNLYLGHICAVLA